MGDRLVELLKCFELRARLVQAGPLCQSARFDGTDGLAYIHVLRQGTLRVDSPGYTPLLLDEPSLFFYMNLTPLAYLSEWRLGVAQSLLLKGKPLQLAADVVGYGSAGALSHAFRAQTGKPPTHWLRQHGEP
jgi:hypothetical protein